MQCLLLPEKRISAKFPTRKVTLSQRVLSTSDGDVEGVCVLKAIALRQ